MNLSLALFFVFPTISLCASGIDCPILHLAETLQLSLSPKQSACVAVNVTNPEAAQAVFDQPVDLEFRIFHDNDVVLIDSFQFGPETLTLNGNGRYQIEVRAKSPSLHTMPTSVMLRNLSSLHPSAQWSEAERMATRSKSSRSIEDAQNSEELWRRIGDELAAARTHLRQAEIRFRAGDYSAARQTFEEARTMCQNANDDRCLAEANNNSGWTARLLGDFDNSLGRMTEALFYWRRLSDRTNEGRTLSNIGLLYWQAAEFKTALDTFEQAGQILRSRDAQAYAWVLNNLGLCSMSLGEYEKASLYFRKASNIAAALKDTGSDSVLYHMNRGLVLMRMDRLEAAQKSLTGTLAEASKQPNLRTRAWVLNNLGQVLWRRHLTDDAEVRLNEALTLHRNAGDKRGMAAALHHLGLIARERGDVSQARDLLREAIQIRTEYAMRDEAAESMTALADLEFSIGDFSGSQSLAEQGAALLESARRSVPGPELRASYFARKRKLLDLLVQIAMRPGNPDAAVQGLLAVERGRARSLLDLLAEPSAPSPLPAKWIEERASLRRRIDFLSMQLSTSSSGSNTRELRLRVESLLSQTEQLEARIRSSIADPQLGHPLESIETLCRDFLPPDAAILEYHLGETRSYLWLIQPTGARSFDLPPGDEIARAVTRLVGGFGKLTERMELERERAAFESALNRLSDALLGPLRGIPLPPRLVLVPDGALHLLPFAALHIPGAKAYLGLAHDLIQAPSATYLTIGRKPRPPEQFPFSVVAIADPVFSLSDPRVSSEARRRFTGARTPDLVPLPFMADLQTISDLVPARRRTLVTGFDANSGRLRSMPLNDYGIVHFSTHAIIDDQIPELSRIALSMVTVSGRPVDGFLHPHDLWDFHLDGATIVLSACDTARGKLLMGEGLVGFSTSLFHAGAAQMVLSLAELDGQASAEFFSEAYKLVFGRRRIPIEHALTMARRNFAAKASRRDPYYWASIVLIGRPSDPR